MCNTLFSLYLLVVQTTSYMWLNVLWSKYTRRYKHCMFPCLPHRSHKWRVNCGFLSWNTSPVILHGWSQNEVTVALKSIPPRALALWRRTETQKESRCERNHTHGWSILPESVVWRLTLFVRWVFGRHFYFSFTASFKSVKRLKCIRIRTYDS